jgi:hypothetical protein
MMPATMIAREGGGDDDKLAVVELHFWEHVGGRSRK